MCVCGRVQVKTLESSLLTEDERAGLESELGSVKQQLAEAQGTVEVAEARNAVLEEEIGAIRGETEGYTAKVCFVLAGDGQEYAYEYLGVLWMCGRGYGLWVEGSLLWVSRRRLLVFVL